MLKESKSKSLIADLHTYYIDSYLAKSGFDHGLSPKLRAGPAW